MKTQELATKWQNIDWSANEQALAKMQQEIALEAWEKNFSTVRHLQKQLVNSLQAKTLAVRHVCESKSQPGIDNVIWETDSDKMTAAITLNPPDYVAQPSRLT